MIRRDDKPIPFNEDWGKIFINRNRHESETLRVSLDAPSHFPMIRSMAVSPDGLLIVNKWTWNPDQKNHYLVLDRYGKKATLSYRPENLSRVITIYDKTAYLRGYDDDTGRARILKCPAGSIDEVVNNHPLNYAPKKRTWVPIKP